MAMVVGRMRPKAFGSRRNVIYVIGEAIQPVGVLPNDADLDTPLAIYPV